MRQLWREGSQHLWVQSVSQLPHLEMHFQPQLGVLTGSFDPCEPSWDQSVRSSVAPLHGVLCQNPVPAPLHLGECAGIWEWTGVMCRNQSLWLCLSKQQPSSVEQNHITHPFTWESRVYNTQFLCSDFCAQITLSPVFRHSTVICYFYAQHYDHTVNIEMY